MVQDISGIAFRYQEARMKIDQAAVQGGRKPEDVTLVVVTKAQPVEVVEAVIQAGATDLGENYPEESVGKIDILGKHYPSVRWHMIGHLQSRKTKLVVDRFSCIQSIDSLHLAEKADRLLGETGKVMPVFLEFNVGDEVSKFGWDAQDESAWASLVPVIEPIFSLRYLQVQGLMTMPPLFEDPQKSRPYFSKLRRLRDFFRQNLPQSSWGALSMGTSTDYEVAVLEGATVVRIGQAITGPRPRILRSIEN